MSFTKQEGMKVINVDEYREWYDSLKAHPCKDCGNQYEACAMDWFHVRPNKMATVAEMKRTFRPKEEVTKEIEKCVLVCAVCSRIRTQRLIETYSEMKATGPCHVTDDETNQPTSEQFELLNFVARLPWEKKEIN